MNAVVKSVRLLVLPFLAGIPLKRLGTGAEVADACLFLGSDLSSYVSGQTLSVCGALNC